MAGWPYWALSKSHHTTQTSRTRRARQARARLPRVAGLLPPTVAKFKAMAGSGFMIAHPNANGVDVFDQDIAKDRTRSDQIRSDQADQIRSDQISSDQIRSDQIRSDQKGSTCCVYGYHN